jgi:hypothetical protein
MGPHPWTTGVQDGAPTLHADAIGGYLMASQGKPISFTLSPEHQKALEALAGSRRVRLSGTVAGDKLVINFVACNAPFLACNAPFTACNAPFTACNAPFTSKK